MPPLPDILASGGLLPSASLLVPAPLARVRIGVAFSRAVTFAAQSVHDQSQRAWLLAVDEEKGRAWVWVRRLAPQSLHEPALGYFEFVEGAWVLRDYALVSSPAADAAPFDGLVVERAALAARDARSSLTSARDETIRALAALLEARGDAAPGYAWRELGQALVSAGRQEEAIQPLARAIALGSRHQSMAHAVHARLLVQRDEPGDVDGALADVDRMAAASPCCDEDGDGFGEEELAMHVGFLRGLALAGRDDAAAIKLLEAVAADRAKLDGDTRATRTLEPEMTRHGRSDAACRALSAIAARQGDQARALQWLDAVPHPIDADGLARGRALVALGRVQDAIAALASVSLPEAAALLAELRKQLALQAKRPPAAAPEGELDLDARVTHAKFGGGKVVDVEVTGGRAVRITVAFDDGSERTLPATSVRSTSA